jgi:hypothetical protein
MRDYLNSDCRFRIFETPKTELETRNLIFPHSAFRIREPHALCSMPHA